MLYSASHCQCCQMNCIGRFCCAWWAEVWWWLSLHHWAIWHSQIKSLVCHLGGIGNHIQFTHYLQSPGCFPLLKHTGICRFLQVFWIQLYQTGRRDTRRAINTKPLSLMTAFSIWKKSIHFLCYSNSDKLYSEIWPSCGHNRDILLLSQILSLKGQ